MKMKHWAYIGAALIAVNASLLKVAWAFESRPVPFFSGPVFQLLRYPLTEFWKQPLPTITAPVNIRLFAGQKLKKLWLKQAGGFMIVDHGKVGNLMISIKNQRLSVYQNRKYEMTADELTIYSTDSQAFELKTTGKHEWTSGEIHLSVVKGEIRVINRLAMEDYVSGVPEGELGSLNLNPEALKAQVIVARTYALSMRGGRHSREGFEFCDQPHCQVYSGIPVHHPAFLRAIRSVRGEYLSFQGRAIPAFYHHNCGGIHFRGRRYMAGVSDGLLESGPRTPSEHLSDIP